MYWTKEKVIAYHSYPSLILNNPVKYEANKVYADYCVARRGPCVGNYVYPLYLNCPVYKRYIKLKSSERLIPYPDQGPIPEVLKDKLRLTDKGIERH